MCSSPRRRTAVVSVWLTGAQPCATQAATAWASTRRRASGGRSLCRLASQPISAISATIATPIATSAQVSVPLEVSVVAAVGLHDDRARRLVMRRGCSSPSAGRWSAARSSAGRVVSSCRRRGPVVTVVVGAARRPRARRRTPRSHPRRRARRGPPRAGACALVTPPPGSRWFGGAAAGRGRRRGRANGRTCR